MIFKDEALEKEGRRKVKSVLRKLECNNDMKCYICTDSDSYISCYLQGMKDFSTETYDHSIEVAKISYVLGKVCQVKERDLKNLIVGGILHDIGKLYIAPIVLFKESSLTAEETNIIRQHSSYSSQILTYLANYTSIITDEVIDIAMHHHEKTDGTGYPDRLWGNRISFLSQIVAVADIFDALTRKRCYKEAYSEENAINIMRSMPINQGMVTVLQGLVTHKSGLNYALEIS